MEKNPKNLIRSSRTINVYTMIFYSMFIQLKLRYNTMFYFYILDLLTYFI